MKSLRDWRQALRTPHVYRVGNSTFRIQSHYFAFFVVTVIILFMIYSYPTFHGLLASSISSVASPSSCHYYKYNKTYPITPPVKTKTGISFRIGIISDLDQNSKSTTDPNTWFSLMKRGSLLWMPERNFMSVSWDENTATLVSSLAMKGRGMELSELVTFDGRLLTFDDRTGMVFSIEGDQVFPWIILMDGNGKNAKGKRVENLHFFNYS